MQRRAHRLFLGELERVRRRTNAFFVALLVNQAWVALAIAWWWGRGSAAPAPTTLWTAGLLGAGLAAGPCWAVRGRGEAWWPPLAVAAGQVGFAVLFIALSGGRAEAHFHVFVSLALLALYRDWRPLALAAALAVADFLVRGAWWPQSLFGPGAGGALWLTPRGTDPRWLEHVGWVGGTLGFLLFGIRGTRAEMRAGALRQAQLEDAQGPIESVVAARTTQVVEANRKLAAQLTERTRTEQELLAARAEQDRRIQERNGEVARLRTDLSRESAGAKAAREEASRVTRRYAFLLDTLSEIIWTTRPDGTVDCFNAGFCAYTGLTPEQSLEWGWRAVVHPDDLPGFLDAWECALGTGRPFEQEFRLRGGSDGAYRWHHARARPLVEEPSGRVLGWFGACTDVDAAREAADALRTSEERLHGLVQASDGLVWCADPEGRVETDLPGWRVVTGQTWEQLRGFGWLEAIHPDDRARTAERWMAAVTAQSTFATEFRLQTAAGGWRHYRFHGEPLSAAATDADADEGGDESGGIREWIGLATDLTALREAEATVIRAREEFEARVAQRTEQLTEMNRLLHEQVMERKHIEAELANARDAAERSNKLKGEFLATMSHEIRTPMNGVIGMTSLLLDTPLGPEQRDYVETIRQSGESLLTIINDILDFSKIEAGKIAFEQLDFDLQSTVDGTLDLLAEAAQAKRLKLVCRVAPEVPRQLRGDPGRLRQVLLNLLSNAVKFTPAGGRVLLQTGREGEVGPDGTVTLRFQVVDTGIGLSAEAQRELFKPFVQADGSTTRRFGGTGLGLAISKQLVELMGGVIGVESAPDQGSTFWFTVRLAVVNPPAKKRVGAERVGERSAASPPSLPSPRATTRIPPRPSRPLTNVGGSVRLRVLVAEDNTVNQKVILRQIGKLGYAADAVANGQEAVAACTTGQYDVILMDCQMPEMDGWAATRAIREREAAEGAGMRIPIVALTASAQANDRDKCLAAGMDDYLSKPVKPDLLAETLGKWGATLSGDISVPTAHGRPSEPATAPVESR